MSLLTSVYVLSSDKNSLSKAVWIIFLLLGFVFAYVIYFMSDERFFFRKPKKRYNAVFERTKKYIPEYNESDFNAKSSVLNGGKYLYKAGDFANYKNTELEYFPSGSEFFDDVLDTVKKAEKFVFIEFFIVSDGVLMKRFFDVLSEKAKSGVDVRLIYDDMGSHRTLSHKTKKMLKEADIKLSPFNRLLPFFSVGLNYRDHRKIVVVDGKIAYTGGCNFADEYINEKRLYGYWKDAGIRLCGEAVDGFTLIFLRQWEYLSGKAEDYSLYLGKYESKESESLVVPYADGLDYQGTIAKSAYENLIASAEEKLYIMTPYFICDDTLINLIKNKAQSGVDVRIILPEIPDKAIVYAVSRNNTEKLIEYGVKLYCMNDSFVHTKAVLTENAVIVGSINMDLRSFYQQFECAVYTNDEKTMASLLSDFEETFKSSTLVIEENKKRRKLIHRVFVGIMQFFAPFM
jgi:cardiolipin synthase